MNKITITGNLTKDPERGVTPGGVNWTRFTVAVRRRHKKGDIDTDFVRVTAWRALGDTCAQYLAKGRKVLVEGTPDVSAYQGHDGSLRASLDITAQEVEFLSPRAGGEAPPEAPPEAPENFTPAGGEETAAAAAAFGDDAPF